MALLLAVLLLAAPEPLALESSARAAALANKYADADELFTRAWAAGGRGHGLAYDAGMNAGAADAHGRSSLSRTAAPPRGPLAARAQHTGGSPTS